jgi:hypothetical protein
MRILVAARAFFGLALPAIIAADGVWADQAWTNVGPQGGAILVLTADPQNPGVFYVGTYVGVFKSVDAGVTWESAGLSGWVVNHVLVDRQDSSMVYALTTGLPNGDNPIIQAFQSTDGGTTWNQTGSPPSPCCAVFTLDAQGTLYAAGYNQRELLTSTDGGASWLTAGLLPVNYTFVDLAIDPQNAGTLYAASAGNLAGRIVGTLFKSTDGGATWSQTGSGLATSNGDFFAPGGTLTIDPKNPRTLYISMTMSGVHKSVDGGATWSAANAGMPQNYQACCLSGVVIDPQNPSTLYAASAFSLYKSTNGGLTWSTAGSGIWQGLLGFGTRPLAVDLQNSNTVYAITQIGLFRSTDAGATFGYYSAPRAVPIYAVALDTQVSGRVYANNYTSSDAGMNWQQGAGTNVGFVALAADPQTAGTVYGGFGNDECGYDETPGMFKSTDGGANWVDLKTSFGCISGIVIDPQNPTTVYAGSWYGGVYKSTDGGASWSTANAGLPGSVFGAYVQALAIDPQNPGTLYAAALFAPGSGVFKSTDGGASWSSTGLPAVAVGLAVDPLNTSTVYAATSTTVFQSLDGGGSWRDLSPVTSGGVYSVAVARSRQFRRFGRFRVNSAVIYVGTDSGVVMSTDGGASWTMLSGSPVYSLALAVDGRNADTLYAGGAGGLFSAVVAPRGGGQP